MDYRLAPALAVRFVGLLLVLLAVVLFLTTAVVGLVGLSADVVVLVAGFGLLAVLVAGWFLGPGSSVVRFDEQGYRVRLIRCAGVRAATWSDVIDASTSSPRGIPCVVIRLTQGRTTTIPVQALAVEREQFVRELQEYLQRGQGLRRL